MIPTGHRLRITVTCAAFPKYDRNLNTGGDNERDTATSWSGSGFYIQGASVIRAAADYQPLGVKIYVSSNVDTQRRGN